MSEYFETYKKEVKKAPKIRRDKFTLYVVKSSSGETSQEVYPDSLKYQYAIMKAKYPKSRLWIEEVVKKA